MKKHSLIDHWDDVATWWADSHDSYDWPKDTIFFIAYERWLNDRELLTVEDGYEWKWTPVPEGARRMGSIL